MLARRLTIVALLFLVALPAEAKPKKVKLDKKKIQALATKWMQARPKTHFERWDRKVRQQLLDEAKALGPIPEGSRQQVVELMWKAVEKHGPRAKKIDGKTAIPTPYGPAWWLQSGRGGKKSGLILGLHGGGVGAGSASEASGKWKLPKTMSMYPQGIRLIHDTWNSVHGERFLLTMIEIAKVQHGVDPDRVYSMGFSMGGTGSMFMAGRHPDLLAGAIPAHGVVPADKVKEPDPDKVGNIEHGLVPNMRNVAVYFYTGEKDVNCEPGTFIKAWQTIAALKERDPDGYGLIRFKSHPGIAHSFPPGEPGKGYKFVQDQRRNAYPTKIVWEYNNQPWPGADADDEGKATRRPKQWMYWLYCERPEDRMVITATRKNVEGVHVVELDVGKLAYPDDFTVYLNERMVHPGQTVVVKVGGKEVYRGVPQPDFVTVLESLDAKLDRTLTFDRKIKIPELD
ncbi:MAG: dienelactone hydrolase family protein [Planctomycetota bacterium]|nr:dienelactone hydrolase family protein [Planctomycetota bacterium]